jgi:hypothetical protein
VTLPVFGSNTDTVFTGAVPIVPPATTTRPSTAVTAVYLSPRGNVPTERNDDPFVVS